MPHQSSTNGSQPPESRIIPFKEDGLTEVDEATKLVRDELQSLYTQDKEYEEKALLQLKDWAPVKFRIGEILAKEKAKHGEYGKWQARLEKIAPFLNIR
jgi:hypothetical protein